MSVAGNKNEINNNNNANNIFTIKDTKWYDPVITLSSRGNQNLSKLLCKGFEISIYWNEQKTKSENKNMIIEYRYLLESNFVGFYRNEGDNAKRFKALDLD